MKADTLPYWQLVIPDLHDVQVGWRGTCPACAAEGETFCLKVYGPNECDPTCTSCRDKGAILEAARAEIARQRQPRRRAEIAAEKAPPGKPEAAAPRFKLLTLMELAMLPPPKDQIEGFFQERSIVEPFGQTSDGKSLTFLDLALSMAKPCESWMGRKILLPGSVVWVNADGGRGLIPRVKAWRQANPGEFRYPFLTLMGSVHLKRPEETGPFLYQLKELKPRPVLIVFDTLSRCLPGVDENDQGEMTAVMESCHRMKEELGATVCLLHHTDKRGAYERGSSVVKNESDTQIRISMDKVSRIITVHCEKQREGEPFPDFYLQLKPVGDSVIVVQAGGPPVSAAAVRREDEIGRIQQDIAAHPLTTRAELAERLELAWSSADRYVDELVVRSIVEEVSLPRVPGQRGAAGKGLRIDPSRNGHQALIEDDE